MQDNVKTSDMVLPQHNTNTQDLAKKNVLDFFSLPLELRNNVYSKLIRSRPYRTRVSFWHPCTFAERGGRMCLDPAPETKVRLVSRQFTLEYDQEIFRHIIVRTENSEEGCIAPSPRYHSTRTASLLALLKNVQNAEFCWHEREGDRHNSNRTFFHSFSPSSACADCLHRLGPCPGS